MREGRSVTDDRGNTASECDLSSSILLGNVAVAVITDGLELSVCTTEVKDDCVCRESSTRSEHF